MNHEKFGDSYDFVKGGILQLLGNLGDWYVHPMFTDHDPMIYADEYQELLGVPAVTLEPYYQVGREAWIAPGIACQGHLLLDPDTGVPFNQAGQPRHQGMPPAARYLSAYELVDIATNRPDRLNLALDKVSIEQGYRPPPIRSCRSWNGSKTT